jgi:putative addiction module component (TIGR02574 family)
MKSTLLKDILDLSPAERIQLVQDIWDSISELPSTSDLTDEQKNTLDRRLAELEKDPQIGLPWEEVVEAIRASR